MAKSTQSRSQLRAVKTRQQIEERDQQVTWVVRHLINGDDENARSLMLLLHLIRDEVGGEQETLLDKITQAAFVTTCDFSDVVQSWARQVRGEVSQQIRKRA